MNSFNFYSPTEVIFGSNVELKAGSKIKALGKKNVMIIYGGGSAVNSGLIEKVENSLKVEGISYVTLGGVKPNPMISFTRKAIDIAKGKCIDFVLAVGGGSVIDTSKAVALGIANADVDIWKFFTREKAPKGTAGVGVVLTLSASGSETSDSCVMTNEEGMIKRGLGSEFNRPVFALMNPENTFTLPMYQVGCGVVDIMMHTLDRYFTPIVGNEITDQIAESILRVAIEKGEVAMKDSHNYDAMSELMWCGSLSHNGLTGLGAGGDMVVHQFGHELSAMYDVAHGASLSAVWDSWAKYVFKTNPSRFARYARNVWKIECDDDEKVALASIEISENYFKSINMPTSLSELGIGVLSEDELRIISKKCTWQGTRTIGQFKVLNEEDVYQVYKMANDKAIKWYN